MPLYKAFGGKNMGFLLSQRNTVSSKWHQGNPYTVKVLKGASSGTQHPLHGL